MSRNVLMYSGGQDSFIISRLFSFDTIVFVKMGNEDNLKEMVRLQQDSKLLGRVQVVELPLAQWELPNKIVPYRNHMLAMVGAQYGNEITFGFTSGDTTKDKDYVFKAQIEGMLNYFALDQHKVSHNSYPYSINLPFKGFSKGEMVNEYLTNGNRVEDLWELSRSCYAGEDKECGTCRSCLRKFVSLGVNGLFDQFDPKDIFTTVPTLETMLEFQKECLAKGRDAKELVEVEFMLQEHFGERVK